MWERSVAHKEISVMNINTYTVTRTQYDCLATDERVFFTQMLHFLNQLWILQKTGLISANRLTELKGIVLGAQVAQSLFLLKLQAGVLYEAWRSIEQSYYRLDNEHGYGIPQESQDALASLKRYFGNSLNLVKTIRHKHAFHYDNERIAEGIDSVPSDDDLEIHVAHDGGSFFCELAEAMANESLLTFAASGDRRAALDHIVQEVLLDVSGWVMDFAHGFCATMCDRLGASSREAELPDVASLSELALPYFVARDA
jgi:hypothetical protein